MLVIIVLSMFSLIVFADDSDSDGLEDAWEGENFGNLLETGEGDPDNDLLTNVLEQYIGSNPNKDDSDDDGFLDGIEHKYGTDPTDSSSYPTESLVNITLVKPSYGVSAVSPFDLEIKTQNKSSCKYSTDANKLYDEIDNSAQFFETTDKLTHTKKNFPAASYIETPIYVFCKTEDGYVNDGFPAHFSVGIDNTPPVMIKAYADPTFVIENLEVDLVAETDDATACRFLAYDTNVSELDELFENINESEFEKKTVLTLTKNTNPKIEDKKSYLYIVACINKAEEKITGTIPFSVDLSVGNEVNETFPSGLISKTSTDIRVVTNKDSTCYYGEQYLNKFPQENDNVHFIQRTNLTAKKYEIPVRCRFTDATIAEVTISFTVDLTKPVIKKFEVENEQCNTSELKVKFLAEDANGIENYHIDLVDSSSNNIYNLTTSQENITIKDLELNPDKTYFVELEVKDKAGNIATKKSSEIKVISPDDPVCKNSLPEIGIKKPELTESVAKLYLECYDSDGRCTPIYYHVINDSCSSCGSCEYIKYNNLLPITATETTTVCYNISDDKKAKVKSSFEIVFEQCSSETNCCNDRQVSYCISATNCTQIETLDCDLARVDTDNDGLSDTKEEECGLDPNNPDDADEDLDFDGLTNKEECNLGTDLNKEDSDEDGYTDKTEVDDGYDPNDADDYPVDNDTDTDEDGIPDIYERKYTFLNPKDPKDAGEDEDGDLLTNLEEYDLGTDMDDKDSDNDDFTDYEEYKKKTDPNEEEDYPRNYVVQILFFILGIGVLGAGLLMLYKNPLKKQIMPKSTGSMVNFKSAQNTMQGMSVQPPQGLSQNNNNQFQKTKPRQVIDKSNLDHEIRKQKDIMKLREMSSVFDQFAEDSDNIKSKQEPEKKEKKQDKDTLSRLNDLSEEDAFEEIDRLSKK